MLRLGIDPEKPYRATFICQDGLCCCNMALISFRLFRKHLGNLRDFFGQMVYRPPLAKKFPYAYDDTGAIFRQHPSDQGNKGSAIYIEVSRLVVQLAICIRTYDLRNYNRRC